MPTEPIWVTIKLCSVMFSTSARTIARWCAEQKVVSKRIGGKRMILLSSVHELFQENP